MKVYKNQLTPSDFNGQGELFLILIVTYVKYMKKVFIRHKKLIGKILILINLQIKQFYRLEYHKNILFYQWL